MKPVYLRPKSLTDTVTHYCPGCTHGIAHRLVAEVIDELDIQEKTIGVASVGCSVFAYNYFDVDFQQAAHGRAPAVATGIKRVLPDSVVFTYQGDGDLASIGAAEILHAAARRENITVIFINNAIYGMTGGQMAPTTLIGQKTTTSPAGRDPLNQGFPLKMCEILSNVEGSYYIARFSLHNSANIMKAKQGIKKAFTNQIEGKGFSMVELLSSCPTNWGMTPSDALKWIETHMIPEYPLGEYKGEEGK
ncbi:MAG TPA: thiamine pyrophosphate-dependent enzyme [Bacillota bacterium]|nr:2-oxoglutarate oxidoreductase [Candidatus Fermentithermobacillaceae bacterium]HOB30638.1 thiamine pyrophosphate-dependent enzyme [Bacillota bacterium]HOK64504.1 thiamine pyrophosphate-dependent enzyme [Bacillota bacterium]HOL11790.1 thiamine pyrophosphate-dependent enzyme [Bacillota bacterium]HOQ02296.1 thiamine pyrophosphate-dependent enzyme [Bacillota bacterium]